MKKLALLITMTLIVLNGMAQDIIFTHSNSRIIGKVIEISDTEVKYTQWGIPNADTLTMSATEIDCIHLANGEVFVPPKNNQNVQNTQKEAYQQKAPNIMDELQQRGSFLVEKKITLKSGKDIILTKGRTLSEYVKLYDLKGSEKKDLLRQTCPEAYKEYRNSLITGSITIVSVAGFVTTLFWGILKNANGNADDINSTMYEGALYTFGGISAYFFSDWVFSNPEKYFNKWSNTMGNTKAELSINISPVSFGLTLNF